MQLPEAFIESMRLMLGDAVCNEFFTALSEPSPVTVRMNPFKIKQMDFSGDERQLERVPWSSEGFYLSERPAFTFDPLFHCGTYYVQEASSMFLERAVRSCQGTLRRVLDLCAAPGGKSTLLRSILPEGCLLVSNEPLNTRAQVLAENMQKWGHPDVVVSTNFPADFSPMRHFFDLIAADVPCSGEGMFRKDAQAVSEWSFANVEKCWIRQREIVRDVWSSLRPGGYFIYSTCTYNTHEDEENVLWIAEELGAEVLPIEISSEWGVRGCLLENVSLPVYHFIPPYTKGEGFFLALLRKKGESDCFPEHLVRKKKGNSKQPVVPKKCKEWIGEYKDFDFQVVAGGFYAVRKEFTADLSFLQNFLKIIYAGVPVAMEKGKDLLPLPGLALSTALSDSAFPIASLTYEQAIAFLRKEAIVLGRDVPAGIVLVSYRGLPIGFVKNLGNRANNLYPAEWRIKSTHIPDCPMII